LQDTFLKLYTHKNSYKNIAKFSTWIYTIAGNFAKTELRKTKRRKTYSNSELTYSEHELVVPDYSNEPDKDIIDKSLKQDLQECLSNLPLDFRTIIILRYHLYYMNLQLLVIH